VAGEVDTRLKFWSDEISSAQSEAKAWHERCKKIAANYAGETSNDETSDERRSFNALWVNQEILRPAVFTQLPQASCKRRHKSSDQIANAAAQILTNALAYNAEIANVIAGAVDSRDDYLLFGRGTLWAVYENEQGEGEGAAPAIERVSWVHVPAHRFLHSKADKWEDVWWVARKASYTKAEIERLYPDHASRFDFDDRGGDASKTADLWQIWDKRDKRVVVYSKHCDQLLSDAPPPFSLDGFFPCPRPAYGTLKPCNLFPIADFNYYREESDDIDEMMSRVSALIEAAKTRGVYDANFTVLRDLFRQRENEMVPITGFNEFAAKGGMKGAMELFDTSQIVATIKMLLELIANKLDTIYQKTGIADIMRSLSDPSETLGAQKLKAGYGNIRLQQKRGEMARIVTEMMQITGEIIAELYHDQTLELISGVILHDPPPIDFATGQAPQRESLAFPEMYRDDFAAAVQLLKSKWLRRYKIDIESDTTVAVDEEATLRQITEIMTALGQFMTQAIGVGASAPALVPVMAEAVKMMARSFRLASGLEPLIEEAVNKMVANSKAPPPPPAPTVGQVALLREQRAAMKDQADVAMETERLKMEQQQHMADVALTQRKIQQKDQEILLEAAQEKRLAEANQPKTIFVGGGNGAAF